MRWICLMFRNIYDCCRSNTIDYSKKTNLYKSIRGRHEFHGNASTAHLLHVMCHNGCSVVIIRTFFVKNLGQPLPLLLTLLATVIT